MSCVINPSTTLISSSILITSTIFTTILPTSTILPTTNLPTTNLPVVPLSSDINNCVLLLRSGGDKLNVKNCINIIGDIFKEVASDKMACWVNANQVCPTQLPQICGAMCISTNSNCATFISKQISHAANSIVQSITDPFSLIGNVINEITYLSTVPKCDVFTITV